MLRQSNTPKKKNVISRIKTSLKPLIRHTISSLFYVFGLAQTYKKNKKSALLKTFSHMVRFYGIVGLSDIEYVTVALLVNVLEGGAISVANRKDS